MPPNVFSFHQPTSTPSISASSQDNGLDEKETCRLPPLPTSASQLHARRNECCVSPNCGKFLSDEGNDGFARYANASPINIPRPTHESLGRKKALSINTMQLTSPLHQSFSGGKVFLETSTSISFFRQNVSLMSETNYVFGSRALLVSGIFCLRISSWLGNANSMPFRG